MREVVIVEAVRTPIGRRNGKLKDVHPVVLGSLVLKELVHRAGIKPEQVDDVVFGCVSQVGEQSLNVGRNAWLTALQVDDVVFGCVSQVGEQSLNVGRNAWLIAGF